MKNILSTLAISALVSVGSNALISNSASAAINFVMGESGNDIRMEWTGSVNTNGLGTPNPFPVTSGQTRAQFNLWSANGGDNAADVYFVSGVNFNFTNPATSFWDVTGIGTGGSIGIQSNGPTSGFITLPENYVSDTQVNGSLILANTSFASLGVIDGVTSSVSWDFGFGLQEIIMETDRDAFPTGEMPEDVPEPSTILGTLIAGGIGIALKNKRRQS
ncbi:MAG: PEP-CTERM sorting domain-containing protein [Cyanobacteriota bacterium]|nr:PEP-CTERM sorting domain-containing protein [Cyanobacteriota bacterium]